MDNRLFKEYFDSIFKYSNIFSKEEYEQNCRTFEAAYGPFLPLDKKSRILDIGCGAGHFLYFLTKKGYVDCLGIDVSGQQIDFCKKNISQHVIEADAFDFLRDKTNTFDAIVANDVIEHIPKDDIIGFLDLIHKALSPHGVLLLKTFNLGNPFAIFGRYKDFTHTTGFTEKSLYQVLWLAGFRDIKILPNQEKGFLRRALVSVIWFFMGKLFWYQGFVAPRILSPLIFAAAKK